MGGAISTPPADDAPLTADEVKALIGEDKFDQAQFDGLAGEGNTTITFAQLKSLFPAAEVEAPPADDESEDDENDYADEDAPVKVVQKKGRKTGVSSESMDPDKMKEQMKNITCVVKSPEVHEHLLSVVAKSPLLRTLDADQKEMIVNAFTGPNIVNAGDDIIVQGENGEIFYLIEDGQVDVYIKINGEDKKVHAYKPGDAFGELAIMYNAPRAATCRAATEAKVWQLDRLSFKCIVVAAAMQKREVYQGFLKGVKLLSECNEGEIMTLADSLAEEKYADGEEITKQGEPGEYFYIVKEGKISCLKDDVEVLVLEEGGYFGEIALLESKPRQATCKAVGPVKVLALDRATFTRVLGPMEDILKRNMEAYNAVVSA
jgi:cAMP-dependent protein kinase regulator